MAMPKEFIAEPPLSVLGRGEVDMLLAALIDKHGPAGRADIAPELLGARARHEQTALTNPRFRIATGSGEVVGIVGARPVRV